MMSLEELKKKPDLIDEINWDMTPERRSALPGVGQQLGAGDGYVIRSKGDYTTYSW